MNKNKIEKKEENKSRINKFDRIRILKMILAILGILVCIVLSIYLFKIMKTLYSSEGQEMFKERVANNGIKGALVIFLLQLSQMFLFIVPGEPIEILAGMCYGAIGGTIFILVSALIITIAIFYLSRKFGRKFVCIFCDEEKVKKIENSKTFRNPKKIEIIMFILFLIPGTPKDLLVYIAGLLPIKPMRFIFISTFARIPSIISSTIAGTNIAKGDWKTGIILYLVVVAITALIIYIFQKYDKHKLTKEALDSLK